MSHREPSSGADLPAALLEAALQLAHDGHPVLPLHTPRRGGGCSCGRECGRPGKHPFGGYGLSRATTDPGQVAAWWEERPDANVAMRCDRLAVLDVDGREGARSVTLLEAELGPLPATWEQSTGRGRHLVFAADVAGNSTRGLGSPPGVDVRAGRHGYVVAAPSLHATGNRYSRSGPAKPAPLPDAWQACLSRPPAPLPEAPRPLAPVTTAYGRAALAGELERLLVAAPGCRNTTLNLVTFRLAQLAAGGELALDELTAAVRGCAFRTGLDPVEINQTMRAATRAGLLSPRGRK